MKIEDLAVKNEGSKDEDEVSRQFDCLTQSGTSGTSKFNFTTSLSSRSSPSTIGYSHSRSSSYLVLLQKPSELFRILNPSPIDPPVFSRTMLRSLPRAAPSSVSFRGLSMRSSLPSSKSSKPVCVFDVQRQQRNYALAHAISNPTLAGIEKRWEKMPPQEQAELWMSLRDRMKSDWHEMTLQERKTCEYSIKMK